MTWSSAADKHQIPRDETLYALGEPYMVVDPFGRSRSGSSRPPVLYIGPSRYGTLEILVLHDPAERGLFIFHVMRLRMSTALAVGYRGEGT